MCFDFNKNVRARSRVNANGREQPVDLQRGRAIRCELITRPPCTGFTNASGGKGPSSRAVVRSVLFWGRLEIGGGSYFEALHAARDYGRALPSPFVEPAHPSPRDTSRVGFLVCCIAGRYAPFFDRAVHDGRCLTQGLYRLL